MSTVNGFQIGSETLKYNYESLENYNTPEFSTTKTYAVGDYVIYQGKLYKCTTAVTTAGSWSSSNWTLAVLSDDVSSINNALNVYFDNNVLSDATWFQGTWGSFGNLDNTGTAPSLSRLSTQIELESPVDVINFVPIVGAKFRLGLFDVNGVSKLAMSSFNDEKRRCEYKKIKYIRITIGFTDDGHISAYNNIVYGFTNDYYSFLPAGNKLTEIVNENANTNQKLSALFSETNTISLDSTNLELGSLSNGTPVESDVRARTINYIDCPSSHIFILCPNQNVEYIVASYNWKNVWRGNSSYMTGSNLVTLKGTKCKIVIKYRQAPYGIDLSMLDNFGIYYSVVRNFGNNLRFTVMSHNCGKFNYGNNGGYSGDDVQDKITEWKNMLAKYKPDILLSQELSTYFDSGSTINAFDNIFKPLFPYTYFEAYGRISAKMYFVGGWNESISVVYDEVTFSRSCGCCLIMVDGIPIFICSAHLEPGVGTTYETVREMQRDALLASISNFGFPYVIIGGDFNSSNDEFYDAFEEAGYEVANHGYFGTIRTHNNDSIDNIIIKGFSFYNAESNPDDKCTSDHNPIVADVHIKIT